MKIWGWRIPFILAFFTALMGYYLRRGMPEPHAFLEAARKERVRSSKTFSKRQLTLLGADAEWEASPAAGGKAGGNKESPTSEDMEAVNRCSRPADFARKHNGCVLPGVVSAFNRQPCLCQAGAGLWSLDV